MSARYAGVNVSSALIDMTARDVNMRTARNVDMGGERRVDMRSLSPSSAAPGRVDMLAKIYMMAQHVVVEMGFGIDVRYVMRLVDVKMFALIHMMALNRAVNVGMGVNMVIILPGHDASSIRLG